jgi:hypothetical protein
LTEIRRFLFTFTHLLLLLFVSSSLLLCLVLLALQLLFSSASTLLGGNTHLTCKIHTPTQKQTQEEKHTFDRGHESSGQWKGGVGGVSWFVIGFGLLYVFHRLESVF